jgi:HK97 family phage major capsid protein
VDYESLLPRNVSRDVVQAVTSQSVVLQLGRRIAFPAGELTIPVTSVAPSGQFVNPSYGGKKKASTIEWQAEAVSAEEVAVLVPLPDSFIADSSFPVWATVQSAVAGAFAKAIDDAVLWGVGAPASWPPTGIVPTTPLNGTDVLDAIDQGLAAVEQTGVRPDGIASGLGILSALRGAYKALPAPPSIAPSEQLYGLPVQVSESWDASRADAVVGAWQYLLVAVREDLTVEFSDSAVLTDASGGIVLSAFESDQTVGRFRMRLGVLLGKPVAPDGTGVIEPLQAVTWRPDAPLAASSSRAKAK